MTAKTTNNKHSAKKKLIPAVGMLLASAMALTSSTYAWFTMSREVEVKNIQMTATTPEDIQISLGEIDSHSESISLAMNTGYLKGTTATVSTNDYDWSNIADISHYYAFGKLIPASSATGENIFYTNDASGVGRTLKTGATFYQAAAKLQINESGKNTAAGDGADKAVATSHILTDANDVFGAATTPTGKTNAYAKGEAWNDTNDDGYYIDIPVWLRTTSTNTQDIYVCGYVCDKNEETQEDADDLYKAVRVAILDSTGAADGGCLTLVDGGDTIGTQSDSERTALYPASRAVAATNILDSDNYSGKGTSNKSGTSAVGRLGEGNDDKIYGVSATTPSWTEITASNSNDGDSIVATLAAGTGTVAGTPTKLIIRVWLEGEDGNCWNENAGQDWNIALKFSKDPLPAGT